jgi:hypothetical protein
LFGAVAERFILRIAKERRGYEVEQILRREFIRRWANRPIADIMQRHVLEVTDAAVARGALFAAHHYFAYVRRLFNWAISRDLLALSPCDRLKPKDIIGPKVTRLRTLTDEEIGTLWAASVRIGYPYGSVWQLLLITGQRKSGIAAGGDLCAGWGSISIAAGSQTPVDLSARRAPHVGPAPPAVLYRYTSDRKAERCREHLATFRGHLHADADAGFAELYKGVEGKPAVITEVGAHVRRGFFDVHKSNGSAIARGAGADRRTARHRTQYLQPEHRAAP